MVLLTSALFSLAFVALAQAAPWSKKSLGVQAHRGGLGLRPESTLQAFAYSLEIGSNVLEMDMVFTKDGVPVIWHDHQISGAKCKDTATSGKNFPYVGKYIANLTSAQVKTLDCGSLQLAVHKQAKLYPGAEIPTLEEVLELVDCYGDRKVETNLETKIDPLHPNETKPIETYITDLVPILKKHKMDKRTYVQSFDWRILTGIKKKFPGIRTVALLDPSTIAKENGGFPWLGRVNLDKFNGDYVKAARSIGVAVLSPVHGTPSSSSVNTPGYVPFVTKEVVERAHKLGMKVIPWTADDESTISKLITDGVDEIISNYPERVLFVGRDRGYKVGIEGSKHRPWCLKNSAIGGRYN